MPPLPDVAEPAPELKRKASVVLRRLTRMYPVARTALDYVDPWQLIVATVLSAQTTDDMVNKVTPELFRRWPTAFDLAEANPEEVETVVKSTGFFRQKTRSILGLAAAVVSEHGGEVPTGMDQLIKLPGVGRKTASVVIAEAWGRPAIAVDTHVKRVSHRIGLTASTDPVVIEAELRALYPRRRWADVSMRFIEFGREYCDARKPRCWECPLRDRCDYPAKTPKPK